MTYFILSHPFAPMPIAYWIMNILIYSILMAATKLLLFQHVSKLRVPLFIYVIMSVAQLYLDDTAVLNEVLFSAIAIVLIYYTANKSQRYPFTKIAAYYLYMLAIYSILTMLISNVFMHLIHHWDPTMHSVVANYFTDFEIIVVYAFTLLALKVSHKVSDRYFKYVVPNHYIWSWAIALSIFPIVLFDFAVVLYHVMTLPSLLITATFVGYLMLLWLAMAITGKYYCYQENNQLLKNELASLTTYTSYIETLYDDLRRFRHDYKNILFTLSQSLKNDDVENAKSLIDEMTNSSQLSVSEKYNTIGHLANVGDFEVKSLLFNKSMDCFKKDIQLQVEVEKPFKFNANINSLDLIRMLSILLDNAINAAEKSADKKVNVSLFDRDGQYLVIGNSTEAEAVDLSQLGKTSMSSRHGIGLKNLRAILSRYPNVQHQVSSKNHWFEQVIRIPNEAK